MASTTTPFMRLQLGDLGLWRPPFILSELTGTRSTYTAGDCDKRLESSDLTYKLYLQGCELGPLQEVQLQIEETLRQAPNLTLIRQDTPDALEFRNKVKSGTLDLSNDQTELRARFGLERTLALVLSLTILPSGAGDGDAAFRHLKYLSATGAFNWTTDTIGALLIDDASTVPDELYVKALDGFVTLSEISGGGYSRQSIGGRSVLEGSQVQLLGDDPTFTSSGGATGMVLYVDNGGDATNVPIFLISFAPLDSGLSVVHLDLLGLY